MPKQATLQSILRGERYYCEHDNYGKLHRKVGVSATPWE